jgi:hypothetical protein
VDKRNIVKCGEHIAEFEEIEGMVRIKSEFGTKATQLGDLPAPMVAGQLLREQVAAAKLKL